MSKYELRDEVISNFKEIEKWNNGGNFGVYFKNELLFPICFI